MVWRRRAGESVRQNQSLSVWSYLSPNPNKQTHPKNKNNNNKYTYRLLLTSNTQTLIQSERATAYENEAFLANRISELENELAEVGGNKFKKFVALKQVLSLSLSLLSLG
jgi:hypothetical protein